jgi:hypothetical protein
MKRKVGFLLMLLGVVSLALLVAAVLVIGNTGDGNKTLTSFPTDAGGGGKPGSYAVITGTRGIPIYPGSQVVDMTDDELYLRANRIDDANLPDITQDEVVDFYRTWLSQNGWVITRDESDPASEVDIIEAVWKNPMEGPPTRLSLYLGFAFNRSSNEPEMHMWLNPWAEPDKLPLMPDAQQVTVDTEKHPVFDNDTRVTRYLTAASPDQVRGYYQNTMPLYGWEEVSSEYKEPGITFQGKGSYVAIRASAISQDQTQVTLIAWGVELH